MCQRPIRRVVALAALAVPVGLGACDSPSEPSGLRGTYTLEEANGVALPVIIGDTIDDNGSVVEFELTGGELRIQAANNYVLRLVFDVYVDGVLEVAQAPLDDLGKWAHNAGTVTFDSDTDPDAPAYTGDFDVDRILVDFEGNALLFVKG